MKPKYLLVAFGVLCIVQLLVPFYQMATTYAVLQKGEAYYFDVAPLDPYDAFRGRYVTLHFMLDSLPYDTISTSKRFVKLHKSPSGEALFGEVSHEAFTHEANYLELTEKYRTETHLKVQYPIERFYMNEFIAPKADSLLLQEHLCIQAGVRVYKGAMAIEGLYVNGLPITEYLQSSAVSRK